MSIQDLVGNPLAPATMAQVLGYDEPPAAAELLPLRMYDFLIRPIREQDATEGVDGGNLFVKRYLEGPQTLWERVQARLFEIKDLWDLERIEDEYLTFLKNIVGWTDTVALKRITDPLSPDALRRLIGSSIPLWKQRGPEDMIVDILQLLTAKRARTWNWFETVWVNDVSEMGEDHQGRDPFILDLPGPPNTDELRYNVRIVDDGNEPQLDRNLVREVAKLMRPVGERVEITYLLFLDRFLSQGDDFQWTSLLPDPLTVTDGLLKLEDSSGDFPYVSVEGSDAWAEYVAYTRAHLVSGPEVGLRFHQVDVDNWYSARLDTSDNRLRLVKTVGGTPTALATFWFGSVLETITTGEWFGIRAVTTFEGSDLRIKLYVDGQERINYLDTSSPHAAGTVGIEQPSASVVHVDEVEVFGLPVDSEEVGINPA
jgi:hypothetical protein